MCNIEQLPSVLLCVQMSPTADGNRQGPSLLRKKRICEFPVFDLKLFLDSAGLGRKVAKFRAKETVFAQGDPAKNVMYIQEGGVKLTVVNEAGKEAVVAILGPGDFFGEGALRARPFAWRLRPRLHQPPCCSLRKTR